MIKELHKEAQHLRANLSQLQQRQLDKLLAKLSDLIGGQEMTELVKRREIDKLLQVKNLIQAIYLLLKQKVFNGKVLWEWEVGEKGYSLLDPEYQDKYKIKFDPDFSQDGQRVVTKIENLENKNYAGIAVDGRPWDYESYAIMGKEISGDGQVIVGKVRKDQKDKLIINNKKEWKTLVESSLGHDEIAMNNDGSVIAAIHCLYPVGIGHLVVNDKIWPQLYYNITNIRISPDSQKIAATVETIDTDAKWSNTSSNKHTITVNDKLWEREFEECSAPFISPDSQKIAATVKIGNQGWTVCVDGKKPWSKKYNYVSNPCWSPDSKKIAVAVNDKDDPYALLSVDQKEWRKKGYDSCGLMAWSPDSQKLATFLKPEYSTDDYVLFINKKEIDHVNREGAGSRFVWSPDSQKYAYKRKRFNERDRLIVAGKEWKIKAESYYLQEFSPDSQKFAVIISQKYDQEDQDKYYQNYYDQLVINDQVIPEKYHVIRNFSFSPDSQKIMFVVKKQDGEWYRIVKDVSDIK